MPVTTTTLRHADHFVAYVTPQGASVTVPRDVSISVYTPATPGLYPVIVYSHGHGGSGSPMSGAGATAQALADQGYIVLAPSHLDSRSSYPSWLAGQFNVSNPVSGLHRSADIQFTLDQVATLLVSQPGYIADMSRVTVAGHSHGAFTAGLIAGLQSDQYGLSTLAPGNPYGIATITDARFHAAILLSPQGTESTWAGLAPGAWDTIRIPVLVITGTEDSEPGGLVGWESRLDPFGQSNLGRTAAIVYRNAAHNDIGGNTTDPLLTVSIAGWADQFLDAYLGGDPAALALFSNAATLVAAEARLAQAFVRPVTGTTASGVLIGTSGADSLNGLTADDLLLGLAGNDSLNGGAGMDTADYVGVRRQYVASSTSVSGNGEGTDALIAIEQARFVDGILTFDAQSASAQVMRLYSATLNRVPDQGGLEANTGALASLGLQGLANTFVASAEFQARFGALNNQQFVEQLYVFALGRTGDPAGIASWVALLDGGASRGQVVVGFSESAENIGRTAATLNAGLWVPDQQALIIARLYDATFKRLPDVEGLAGWVNALKGGTSQEAIAAAFAGSAEFQATFGALSNQAFVEQLYRFCLNREGDAGGIAGWVNALNTGTSRASVLLGFSESAEHVALTANLWLGGIRFAGFVGSPAEDAAKDLDGPQVLPDIEVVDIAYDPADLGLSFPDKDADAFVLPAVPDMPLPTVDPADPFNGLDLALLRAEAFNNSGMMLILPEAADATPDFDLDAWSPAQRDGHWLM